VQLEVSQAHTQLSDIVRSIQPRTLSLGDVEADFLTVVPIQSLPAQQERWLGEYRTSTPLCVGWWRTTIPCTVPNGVDKKL